jgi:hypothetical protein
MLSDLATPFYVLIGAALFAVLARVRWPNVRWFSIPRPRISVQTERQTCQGIQVTDVALSFSGWRTRTADLANTEPRFEGTVYIVWKRKN